MQVPLFPANPTAHCDTELLRSFLQRKLAIGAANDPLEHEAERVADRVMRMPDSAPISATDAAGNKLQRKCSYGSSASHECDPYRRQEERVLQPSASYLPQGYAPPIVHNVLGSSGNPLDHATRSFFEPRFRCDFTKIRIHADERAAQSAKAVNAKAFAVGQSVVFGAGQYAPGTSEGKSLLAHELTHVVQQSRTDTSRVIRRDLDVPSDDKRDAGAGPGDISGAPRQTMGGQIEQFFHGTTWRIAKTIPGNVQAIGGGDFGQGFYTHHDEVPSRAEQRAREWGCSLSKNMNPPERYAGVIRFDVAEKEYQKLFTSRKYFGLTSTTQPDYEARRQEWLNFVSGPNRGREATPTFDPASAGWRHSRVDPPPDLGYDLIEGPFYRGVPGLPGTPPPRSAFKPYSERGTVLPQQVVWNHQRALDVLNAAPTKLTQYDAQDECKPVPSPHDVPPLNMSIAEDPRATEAAQRALTGGR